MPVSDCCWSVRGPYKMNFTTTRTTTTTTTYRLHVRCRRGVDHGRTGDRITRAENSDRPAALGRRPADESITSVAEPLSSSLGHTHTFTHIPTHCVNFRCEFVREIQSTVRYTGTRPRIHHTKSPDALSGRRRRYCLGILPNLATLLFVYVHRATRWTKVALSTRFHRRKSPRKNSIFWHVTFLFTNAILFRQVKSSTLGVRALRAVCMDTESVATLCERITPERRLCVRSRRRWTWHLYRDVFWFRPNSLRALEDNQFHVVFIKREWEEFCRERVTTL